jgi:hypothetical protein
LPVATPHHRVFASRCHRFGTPNLCYAQNFCTGSEYRIRGTRNTSAFLPLLHRHYRPLIIPRSPDLADDLGRSGIVSRGSEEARVAAVVGSNRVAARRQ